MARDSLCVWKCVSALNGTGVGTVGALEEVPLLPPEDAAVVEREVPFKEVFALDETFEDVLVLVSTLLEELAVEAVDSAELELTDVRAVVVLLLLEASVETADVELVGSDEFAPPVGVSSALPDEVVAPAPAPEDEPAVFDATAVVEPLGVD
jgi:hypothetical protein